MDTERRPVDAMLRAASGRLRWHMPGHKGRAPFPSGDPWALDTTELPVTDDLMSPSGAVREAEALWARAAGAGASLMTPGGATAGVHTLLQLWAAPGDTVLLPRSAHLSAVNACVLGGLRPVWIPARQTADGFLYMAPEAIREAVRAHPEAKALLLTRPDYYGGLIPLPAFRREGLKLVVDEAHGAHLPWMPEIPGAAELGADAWVQSCHKTLPALTGTAVIHLRDAADAPAARRILRREQSSSPNYLLVRSIDDARAWMEAHGAQRLREIVRAADALRARLPALGYADAQAGWKETGYAFDPTRLVIDAPQGGHRLAAQLAALGADVEMSDTRRVVCILTAMDTPEDLARLEALLRRIPPESAERPVPPLPPLPPAVMTPLEAACGRWEPVPLAEAAGRVAADPVGAYPPGIPLAMPGELLTPELLEILKQTPPENRFGTEGELIRCVV